MSSFTRHMIALVVVLSVQFILTTGETLEQWTDMAKEELEQALHLKQNHNVAKNLIIFIGDGMGLSTVTASRVYKGQLAGQPGSQPHLTFENFPYVGLAKTYSNDRLTAASAATATALLSGVKINDATLGISPSVKRFDCAGSKREDGRVYSNLKWSIDEGKSAGVIATSRITHATPAAAYAHSADRYWEGITEVPEGCKDIAAQLFDNLDLKVILGGGRRYILLNNQTDPRTGTINGKQRTDGRDLIKEWKEKQMQKDMTAHYVYNKGQFDGVDPAETDYLLGLFSPSHMAYDADRDKTANGEPSISEMTRKAVKILKKNNKGFFLMVEASRIDQAHHDSYAKRALIETLRMDEAVAAAVEETDEKETLIVVTADHSHVFNIAGYPPRKDDLFGFVNEMPENEKPYDKMPFTTLVYGNGPGPGRTNLTGVDTADINFQQPGAVKMPWETHGAEDVGIYASGPMSHLFHGVHQQHYVAHVMAYSSCIGSNKKHCTNQPVGSGSKVIFNIVLVLTALLCGHIVNTV